MSLSNSSRRRAGKPQGNEIIPKAESFEETDILLVYMCIVAKVPGKLIFQFSKKSPTDASKEDKPHRLPTSASVPLFLSI